MTLGEGGGEGVELLEMRVRQPYKRHNLIGFRLKNFHFIYWLCYIKDDLSNTKKYF